MKNFLFYQEFTARARKEPTGNVVAAITGNGLFTLGGGPCMEAIVALMDNANSPVCGGSVALDYLRTKCKRIPEAKARIIHPNLFRRLDEDGANERALCRKRRSVGL